jgi:hypothetical protein
MVGHLCRKKDFAGSNPVGGSVEDNMRKILANLVKLLMYPVIILAFILQIAGGGLTALMRWIGGPCPKCGCDERLACGCNV